jgi:hypothetical protein
LDAVGLRFDLSGSGLVGGDANLDLLFNSNTREFNIFVSGGGTLGADAQLGITAGPVFIFNLPENKNYSGTTVFLGGSGIFGVGLEADVGISLGDYGCKPPIAVYLGAGGGAGGGVYAGLSGTGDITEPVFGIVDYLAEIAGKGR